MMQLLPIYLLMVVVAVLPEFAVINHFFSFVLLSELLVIGCLFPLRRASINWDQQRVPLTRLEKQILLAAGILLTYQLGIDLLRSDDIVHRAGNLVKEGVVLLLFYCIISRRQFRAISWGFLVLVATIPQAMALAQTVEPRLKYDVLMPNRSLLKSHYVTEGEDNILHTGRVTGPHSIAVGLPLFLGYVSLISVHAYGRTKSRLYLVGIALSLAAGFFTLTRSFIFGLPVSLLLAQACGGRLTIRRFVALSLSAIAILAIFSYVLLPSLTDRDERAGKVFDVNTSTKLASNYYAIVGVLTTNPLFGVDWDRNDEMVLRGAANGRLLSLPMDYALLDTNHCLPAAYLKYFGVIGFVMFGTVLFLLTKRVFRCVEPVLPLACLIYAVQFSMTHNTQILDDPILFLVIGHSCITSKLGGVEIEYGGPRCCV